MSKTQDTSLDAFLEKWAEEEDNDDLSDDDEESSDHESESDETGEKSYLAKLKDTDPDFYKFLRENDSDVFGEDESGCEHEHEEVSHKPPESLDVASDESDFEDDEAEPSNKVVVTKQMVDSWEEKLGVRPTLDLVSEICDAFTAAVESLDQQGNNRPSKMIVSSGSPIFNSIVRLCVTRIETAFCAVLNVGKDDNLKESKKWKPLNHTLKRYTLMLVKILGLQSEESALVVLLKHVHQLIPFFACLAKSAKHLQNELVRLWSTNEEDSVRLLAFMSLLRLTRKDLNAFYESVIKSMYLAYVKNCRFTSPSTFPQINFMRRSLSELLSLDLEKAYHHAFVYIRQLSISLRNAVTLHTKEANQSVHNWQFVHSCHLFVELIADTPALEALIFPLSNVISGAITLKDTASFYPLRFHLAKMLTKLSSESGKFVPVLPFYLNVLSTCKFDRRTTKMSVKPVDFSCILKISKSQFQEHGTKEAIMNGVYGGILEYLSCYSHKIYFPELAISCCRRLKEFSRSTKNANFGRKIKQLLDKIEENSKWISSSRRSVQFGVNVQIDANQWETALKKEGTPLQKYFTLWLNAVREEKGARQRQEMDKEYEFIPQLVKKKSKKMDVDDDSGSNPFDGDDADASDDEERFQLKEERGKKRKVEPEPEVKKKKKPKKASLISDLQQDVATDDGDRVETLNLADLGDSDDD